GLCRGRRHGDVARGRARNDRERDHHRARRAARRPAQRDRCPMMTAALRPSEPTIVNVALGDRAYDIVIGRGLLATLGQRIAALRPGARVVIVTEETVAGLHLKAAEASCAAANVAAARVVVAPGEGSKSWKTFEQVCEAIIGAHIERNDLVV